MVISETQKFLLESDFVFELLKQIPAYIFWKDKNSVYLGCNNAFSSSLGLSTPEEIVGKTDYDLPTKKEESDAFRADDKQVIESKHAKLNIEEHQTLPNGQKVVLLTNKVPLFDKKKNVIGVLGIYYDITERKEAEEREKRALAEKIQAEKKSHYLKAAAGSIAHDLRTPLASIKFAMGGIETLLPRLIEGYQKACDANLESEPLRGNKLKILSTSIERCKAEVDFSNHYIDLILGNLKHDSIDTSNYAQHDAIKTIDDALESYPYQGDEKTLIHWQPAINFNFFGNEFYLKNIINNLLKNAFFYIKKCERGEIFITTEETPTHYLLKIKDTAQGAPPEVLQHMFEGYFSKREGGTGLGLTFCKTIMESFGGSIQAESIEGEYMLFILSFPKK